MAPTSRLTWTPGPSGVAEPPTVDELAEHLLERDGPPGTRVEAGLMVDGYAVVNVVQRDGCGEPTAILQLKFLDGTPELVDIAVEPAYRRRGIAFALCVAAKLAGYDLRDVGWVHDGPLTDEGRALRDRAFKRADEIFGPASWEAA